MKTTGCIDFDLEPSPDYSFVHEITGDCQANVRAELEEWLSDALGNAGIDVDLESERTDIDSIKITACDSTGDIIGRGSIEFAGV